jgi:hypothetical protein
MQEDPSKIRKHPRHKVVPRALVLVKQEQDALPFHIVDVSKGGLAYRYLGSRLKRSEIGKINLYLESELIVEGLPVQPVSDLCLSQNAIPLRRGSFRFGDLDADQYAQVERFINTYAEQLCPQTI